MRTRTFVFCVLNQRHNHCVFLLSQMSSILKQLATELGNGVSDAGLETVLASLDCRLFGMVRLISLLSTPFQPLHENPTPHVQGIHRFSVLFPSTPHHLLLFLPLPTLISMVCVPWSSLTPSAWLPLSSACSRLIRMHRCRKTFNSGFDESTN